MTTHSFKLGSIWSKISKCLFFSVLAFAVTFSTTKAEEKSLYERLGGTYNIALTVDHLVDLIYVNQGLNANPILAAIH